MSVSTLLEGRSPLGEQRDIPYHDLGPRGEEPRVALLAGLHGNELNGVFVLARLANFLAGLEAERGSRRLLRRVVIVPAANVLGLIARSRSWPFDRVDVNRVFPGDPTGDMPERIAHAIVSLTGRAYYRVDIHSSNLDIEELPQVRLYDPSDDERASACLFGLSAVIERPVDEVVRTTLGHAWREGGGESFVMQAGLAGGLQAQHCQSVFQALVAFLVRCGVLEGVTLAEETDLHYFGLNQSFSLVSEDTGFFVSQRQVGQWLRAGDAIGEVYDGFSGELRASLRAPVPGLISALRRQPLVCEGDLVARLQSPSQVGSEVADYLAGLGQ